MGLPVVGLSSEAPIFDNHVRSSALKQPNDASAGKAVGGSYF